MHRWKLSALAAAAFVSAALTSTDAAALALGPIKVQSALGEPLQAEIAIAQATAAEINTLAVQIASPEIFRAQGMDYSNAARSIQVQLQRNADGTASLRLSSSTPLQDPFIDLVVETQWSAGHLVRSFTVLLDPPGSQRKAPAPTLAPQLAPAAAPAPASVTGRTYASNNAAPQRAARPAPAPSAAAGAGEKSTRVRSGDTAGQIANAHRPAGVSLDQMLVAMLQSNPNAFVNGNVNRLRAGAVVKMPSREQALTTSAPEARQIVAAQSRDFNAYRRSLASKAPQAAVQAADRSSGGQVQAHVEDANPAAATPDKLTLSKSSVQNATAADERLAMQKQANDQSNRLDELQRNLAELNALTQNPGTTAATPSAASETASAPATAKAEAQADTSALPTTLEVATPATAESTTASADGSAAPPADSPAPSSEAAPATETAPSPTAADAAPQAAAEPKPAPTPAAATPESSLVGDWLENPLLPAGGGLIAVLLGFLGYSAWKRRRAAQAAQDPSLGDSQLHPDSFFESSGGQQVDTSDADGGASTMAYAPSQLDGGGDVDPVAEADVYLAYGRDVQAEEILKEALRTQPERLSIHVKLAEISVKRHDIKALEAVARGMQEVSQPQDPEWQRVVEMGRHMDPAHPFFAAAGSATETATSKPTSAFAAALNNIKPDQAGSAAVATAAVAAAATAEKVSDIDLHLDLPDDGLASQAAPTSIPSATAPLPSEDDFAALELPGALDNQLDLSAPLQPQDPPSLAQDTLMGEDDSARGLSDLDLDLSGFQMPPAADTPTPIPPEAPQDDGLDFDLDRPAAPAPATPAAPPVSAPASNPAMDFDLGSLDLDLGATPEPATAGQPVHNLADDPLSTKLDLAQEFDAIGDSEGARALIEEVLAEASGSLKERAQKMLSDLD